MTNQQALKALSKIYRLVEASEKGYATAAANISAPGLKFLFKYFAQRRAIFKSEILAELNRLGGSLKPRTSVAGMIHRGRVNIFAGMIIEKDEQQKVVLQEVALGEKYAIQAYQRIIKRDMPPKIWKILSRQLDEIQEHNDQVSLLRGKDGIHLDVQLLNHETDLKLIIRSVNPADPSSIFTQEMALSDAELYQGGGATVMETVFAGAFGGALWGGVMGVLAGFGVVLNASPAPEGPLGIFMLWLSVMLGFMLLGAFISSVLGLFIGVGISEEGIDALRKSGELPPVFKRAVEEDGFAAHPAKFG